MLLKSWLFFRIASGGLIGGAALWWVATNLEPTTGTAIVHVTESDVLVQVGGFSYQISEPTFTPLVCQLPAGEHRLVMTGGSAELHVEEFTLRGGEEVVLTAWRSREGASLPQVQRLAGR